MLVYCFLFFSIIQKQCGQYMRSNIYRTLMKCTVEEKNIFKSYNMTYLTEKILFNINWLLEVRGASKFSVNKDAVK